MSRSFPTDLQSEIVVGIIALGVWGVIGEFLSNVLLFYEIQDLKQEFYIHCYYVEAVVKAYINPLNHWPTHTASILS